MKSFQLFHLSLCWLFFIYSVRPEIYKEDQNICYHENFVVGDPVILLNGTNGKELDFTIWGTIKDLNGEAASILVEHSKTSNPHLLITYDSLNGIINGIHDERVPGEVLEGAFVGIPKDSEFKNIKFNYGDKS